MLKSTEGGEKGTEDELYKEGRESMSVYRCWEGRSHTHVAVAALYLLLMRGNAPDKLYLYIFINLGADKGKEYVGLITEKPQ